MPNQKILQPFILASICCLGFITSAYSQTVYRISNSKESEMKLSGTSTLHNWVMNAHNFEGEAKFGLRPGNDSQIVSLTWLTLSLDVLNLKSDETAMDKNAYKALKTDRYKDIYYQLTSASVEPGVGNQFLIRSLGKLSIAGVTKAVAIDVYCSVNKDSTITCTGTDKIKMTDFGVKPPSFMLGAMTTGDSVTLNFTFIYKKQSHI